MKQITILFFLILPFTVYGQTELFEDFLEKGKDELTKEQDKQNLSEAVNNLETAVKLNPESAEAHYYLGYAYERMNTKDIISMNNLNFNLTVKASREYEKTIELQPNYKEEIFVRDPYSSLTSIWGRQAMYYLYRNKSDSAEICFREGKKRGGFGDFFLAVNRKILDLCTESAFLFTMGDNITIPIWYLQTMEKYRTDVKVIDANLLNTLWYPRYLSKEKTIPLSYTIEQLDTLNLCLWDSTEIRITNNDRAIDFTWSVPPSYAAAYLLRGDRLLLDILKQNKFERDVYFSSGFNPKSMLGLRPFLQFNILVDKLMPNNLKQLSNDEFYKLADDLTELFEYVDINSQNNLQFIDMFRYIILDRIYSNYADKKFNLSLLHLLDGKVPAEKYPILSGDLKIYMKRLHEELR